MEAWKEAPLKGIKIVFHGTNSPLIPRICSEGFRLGCRNIAGVYFPVFFGTTLTKAMSYSKGVTRRLLVSALLVDIPESEPAPGETPEALWALPQFPTTIVSYHRDHQIPLAVVTIVPYRPTREVSEISPRPGSIGIPPRRWSASKDRQESTKGTEDDQEALMNPRDSTARPTTPRGMLQRSSSTSSLRERSAERSQSPCRGGGGRARIAQFWDWEDGLVPNYEFSSFNNTFEKH